MRPDDQAISSLSALAARAEESRALSLTQGFDECSANPAGFALTAVNEIGLLKGTRTAFRAHVIAQRTAAGFDGRRKRFLDRGHEFFAARQGNAARGEPGMNASVK